MLRIRSQVQTHNVGPYQNVPTKPVVILSAKVLPESSRGAVVYRRARSPPGIT